MRKFFLMAALSAFTLLLAACGGDSFKGTSSSSTGGTTTGGTVTSLSVSSTPASIPPDGATAATITVVAKDANAAVVSGVAVTITASAGTLTVTQGTTDSNGVAKATLVAGIAAAGSGITVTATSGSVTGAGTVAVTAAQTSLTLLTNSPQIPSDNSGSAKISAIVKDTHNNLLPGVPVSFQVSSGAIAAVATTGTGSVAGVTDVNGLAQANVTTPGDPSNRTITVTATAGSSTGTVSVGVTGTTLSLTGPSSLVQGNTGTCTVVLADSSGHGVGNATVAIASANNNMLSGTSVITDSTGRATFTVKGTVGGTDTISATTAGQTQKISIAVSTQSFNFTAPADGTKVILGSTQQVSVTWTNSGAAVVNQPVTFATTRGTVTTATTVNTDSNGVANATLTSTSSGPAIVQATASGVTAQLNLDFVANSPAQVSLQASPSGIAVGGQSTITAQVRDANNNLVEGATVNFHVQSDPTNGSLSTASASTDAQGRAQAVYTGGNTSSGANGVVLTATVTGVATPAQAQLTVGGQAAFLSLGTGNTVDVGQGTAIYQVTYTVFAVDSHGAALPNVPVSISLLPVSYGKGVMDCGSGTWKAAYITATNDTFAYLGSKMCKNEDTDYTGNIGSQDSGASTTCTNLITGASIAVHAKDYNCNGQLDPGNAAVAAPTNGTTDANGRLDVKITYNRDHAFWVQEQLVASTTVQGTQSSTSTTFILTGAAPDYANCTVAPPGPVSPYGTHNTCVDPR